MLYVTTRDNKDAYTAHRALHADLAPDGGSFVPFRLPVYSNEEIECLANNSFGQNIADILNVFFSAQLTGWDVDLCVGRNLAKLISLSQKILVAEIWHNPTAKFRYVIENLYKKITDDQGDKPSAWFEVAVRIAVLFGTFGEIRREALIDKESGFDVVVNAGDSAAASAVWYAKRMGLPIDTIIFSCDEGSFEWDVLRRGICSTTTEDNSLEQMIYHAFGPEETKKFLLAETVGGVYAADEDLVQKLQNDAFAAAVSRNRLAGVVSSVSRTDSYRISNETACSFGGLQDYRARTREVRPALILVEASFKG